MIVIIDTQVFVRDTLLLRGGIGPVFLHFLALKKGRLFIPDILRLEYLEQSLLVAIEQRSKIDSAFERLHALAGEIQEYALPTENAVNDGVGKRLSDLGGMILNQEMSPDLKIATSNRVLAKRAPVTKSDHGYKDCMIWESILLLPAKSEVHLVSRDDGFFDGSALAPSLAAEAKERDLLVAAYRKLDDVVKLLQDGQPALNVDAIRQALHAALEQRRAKLMAQWHLTQLGPDVQTELTPYFTQTVGHSYVAFIERCSARGENMDLLSEMPLWMSISGGFTWVHEGTLTDLRISSEKLATNDGLLVGENSIVHVGGISIGPRKLPYRRKGELQIGPRRP